MCQEYIINQFLICVMHMHESPTNFFEQCYYKCRFWFLSPKDQWIQVQRTQYNEFVESEFKG